MPERPMEEKLGTTSYAVLGLLTFGPMSGYELLKLAEQSIAHFWSPARSHVYTELRRLARLGLATEQLVQQEQRPNKRVYAITEEGRRVLELWLTEGPYEPDQVRSSFTVRMFFGNLVARSSIVAHVEELRRNAERTLEELRATETKIKDDESLFFPYLTLKSGLAHCEAEIRWADEALEALREREDA
jgi:PadR family transcriptional regulator, regulatory protein AphA